MLESSVPKTEVAQYVLLIKESQKQTAKSTVRSIVEQAAGSALLCQGYELV